VKTLPAIIALLVAACGPHSPAVDSGSTTFVGDDTTSSTTSSSTSSTGSLPDLGEPTPPSDLPSPVDTDRDLLVFITSDLYRGDTITTHGDTPDEICTWHGRSMEGRVWRAWVSMDGDAPADSFTRTSGFYRRIDGLPIAQGWQDLVDGELLAPLNLDEWGNLKPEPWWTMDHPTAYHGAWTGTRADGTAVEPKMPTWSSNCSDWTVADWSGAFGSGVFGYEDALDHQWSQADDVPHDGGGTTNCVNYYYFYCFEQ